jgi:hypothetical protein
MALAELLVANAGQAPGAGAFRERVLALHRRLTSPVDSRGRAQLPWPRALGTPPWAVARHLAALVGTPYVTRWTRTGRRAVDSLPPAGPLTPVALYVGSRWLPRHVVLVVGADAEGLAVYEPAGGRLVRVARTALAGHRLGLAGWDVPWFSVVPAARRTPA